MNIKVIAVLFVVFIVLFSFGCKKEGSAEEPPVSEEEQELPPEIIALEDLPPDVEEDMLVVNNFPGKFFPIGEYTYKECGGRVCSVYERDSTWAEVLKINDRTLTLDTYYEQIEVDVPSDVKYSTRTFYVDSQSGKTTGFSTRRTNDDLFDDINEQDLIVLNYNVNTDETLKVNLIQIIKIEESSLQE